MDFEERPWVPLSGWPFPREHLTRYLKVAMTLCEAGTYSFDARMARSATPELFPGLDGDGIVTYPLERWSPPTHFGKRYRRRMASSSSISVLLNATCTHIQLAASGQSVDHIVVNRTMDDSRAVYARRFVLAAGGLENARLLLSADDVAPTGVGNTTDCVDRFYQTHVFGCFASVQLNPGSPRAHVAFDRDAQGVYFRRRIWFTPDAQEQHQVLNTVFFPVRPPTGATGHRSALFSGVYLVKMLLAAARRPTKAASLLRDEKESVKSHAAVFFRHLPSAVPELYRAFSGRYIGTRRLPAVLPADGLSSYHLQFQAEQVPNADARVTLGQRLDDLGMRRLVVSPSSTALDIESVVRTHKLLDVRLRSSGLGKLVFDEDELRRSIEDAMVHVNSGAHHIGTTRMSDDPTRGVVDRNCKVHNIDNLYLTGASVMPTSGHANPTLTIVALAIRLGEHLAESTHGASTR
ncbi:GMC family oxidoreductase [Microbacterium invictum]|uniref:Glucose-methanol-choline oxidoreductase C-terminal domain-containing protein n=1 Tax=Microbacterium invictum TaxID=515415 RepID=A0AA40VMT6_9MICO|nr:hypothetical protein [Microbacterium invictum]